MHKIYWISNTAYDNLWQEYRDVLELAFTSGENELDRFSTLQIASLNNNARLDLQEFTEDRQDIRGIGGFVTDLFKPSLQTGLASGGITGAISSLLGFGSSTPTVSSAQQAENLSLFFDN